MSDQNDLMSLVGLFIVGAIFLYIGTQMNNQFAFAFVVGGVVGIVASIAQGYRLFAG